MVQNKGLIFAKIPEGVPKPGEHLKVEARDFDENTTPPSGGIVVKNLYASFDPYQRGRMRSPEIKSYTPPFTVGEPMQGHGVAKVIKSDSSDYKEGDLVVAVFPIQEYTVFPKEAFKPSGLKKIDPASDIDPKVYIGALGMPGLTAYSSFYEIGKPKKGETIFISAASGAVGQLVGQLAKHEGLKVIGSVGSDDKLEFITKDLKFDAGFNYKKEKPADALKRLAPNGIDIYYENVGGEHLYAAIDALNPFGRIVACGMVSEYSVPLEDRFPIKNMMHFVAKRLLMQGFIVSDENFGPKYAADHEKNVSKWLKDGSFVAKMSSTKGIDNAAEGWLDMIQGRNFGKAVLEIASE
jgi:NADPH-dependent curcumin reductase CurA